MRRLAPLLTALALLAVPAGAAAAPPPKPFGHSCTPQDGVRFCATKNDAQRVPTFDGVPIDVDVTLPATGDGPFPTIVMLHGFPGTKTSLQSTTPEGPIDPAGSSANVLYHWNNNFFARQGYAVVNYSARGFGRSCGEASSRTSPECDRGWFHLADQRYEIRDAQVLLSKLVDQGIADPKRIGVTGLSYGGGSTMQLAFLRNRIRKLDGTLMPWVSPGGRKLSVAAAYPRWGWSDLVYSLAPNGRFLDFREPFAADSRRPLGVVKESVVDTLARGGVLVGFVAPKGSDPTADLTTWRDRLFEGPPYGSYVQALATQFSRFKGASGLGGKAAPLLIMDGWTDPAFNAIEALRPYNRLRAANPKARVALQLGDLGHFRSSNGLAMYRDFGDDGAAFFARHLKGQPGGPARGSVKAYGQGCPKGTAGLGPVRVSAWSRFARGNLRLAKRGERTLPANGGDPEVGEFLNPVTNPNACSRMAAGKAGGTAVLTKRSPGFTLAGLTTVTATVANSAAFGQLDARLFDVSGGKQRLIDYGTYRLKPRQDGRITFQLAGNLYRFVKGHRVKLELVGRNAPWFLPDSGFEVKVSKVRVDVPTRERPSAERGIGRPPERG